MDPVLHAQLTRKLVRISGHCACMFVYEKDGFSMDSRISQSTQTSFNRRRLRNHIRNHRVPSGSTPATDLACMCCQKALLDLMPNIPRHYSISRDGKAILADLSPLFSTAQHYLYLWELQYNESQQAYISTSRRLVKCRKHNTSIHEPEMHCLETHDR